MLFQVLCGFEPIFYTTHPNEESFLIKIKLRHSLGRPSRSDFVQSEVGKGCTAMLKKLNSFFNIVIGSFIGVFIGFGIYKFWHFNTYPNLYAMQSAPWYTELLLGGALVAVVVVVCIILKLIICRKLKP